nr:MAG TPA_asm: hypothetical protein [Caudoviricetes sp.]
MRLARATSTQSLQKASLRETRIGADLSGASFSVRQAHFL